MKRIHIILLIILTVFCGENCFGQKKHKIENLVFEGGGVKGLAYAGALKALEEEGVMSHIKKVGGTSAGAITALMVSIGYTADQIADIIDSTNFGDFNDGKFFFIGGAKRLVKNYGWYKGGTFIQWLEYLIELKTGDGDITFQGLADSGFMDLRVTGTCLNRQELVIFSKQTYPLMPIKNAIRISMSVPFYYQAVLVDSIGQVYSKNKDSMDLDIMVDGGVLANFPIFLFDKYDGAWNTNDRKVNKKTLGFMIETDEQCKIEQHTHQLAEWPVNNISDYSGAMYNLIIANMTRNNMTSKDWKRTVVIPAKGIGPKVKKLTPEEKQRLIGSGKENTAFFLSQMKK